jgi:ParB/RepB/Spo0J family partition protein
MDKTKNKKGENKMRVEDIKISDIEIIENVRVSIKDAHLNELMASIKQHGLEQPIGVGQTKSGKYTLIFGHRRLTACKKLGWKTIPAKISDEPDLKDFLLLNVTENIQRKDVTVIELGRVCDRLKRQMDMNEKEIATSLSIPLGKVKDAMSIYSNFPKSLREDVSFFGANGGIAATTATEIISLKRRFGFTNAETDSLIKEIKREDISKHGLQIVSQLIKDGMTPKEAVAEYKNYQVCTVRVVVKSDELQKRKVKGEKGMNKLMTRVIYGEEKAFDKPYFMGN